MRFTRQVNWSGILADLYSPLKNRKYHSSPSPQKTVMTAEKKKRKAAKKLSKSPEKKDKAPSPTETMHCKRMSLDSPTRVTMANRRIRMGLSTATKRTENSGTNLHENFVDLTKILREKDLANAKVVAQNWLKVIKKKLL